MTQSTESEPLTPLDVLRRDGWCQVAFEKADGSKCLSRAIRTAYDVGTAAEVAWREAVTDVIAENFPDRIGTGRPEYRGGWIVRFNDSSATDWSDVEAVCEKAQVRYDEAVS